MYSGTNFVGAKRWHAQRQANLAKRARHNSLQFEGLDSNRDLLYADNVTQDQLVKKLYTDANNSCTRLTVSLI